MFQKGSDPPPATVILTVTDVVLIDAKVTESVAVITTLYSTSVTSSGVPVISPVEGSISTPLGKVPLSSYSIPFATGSE